MNRKNIILIAVLINAGLLSVLLIAALTTQEEAMPAPTLLGDTASGLHKLEENPLFGDSIDLAMRKSPQTQAELPIAISLSETLKPAEPAIQLPNPPAVKEEILVHKLPPLVPEAAPAAPLAPAASASPVAVAPASSGPPTAVKPTTAAGHAEVVVKKGDTLEKIAKASRATVDELIKLNHLSSSFLRVGQVLKIPQEHAVVAKTKAAVPEKKPVEASGPEYYTVKVGDNPWTIAMKHHIKVEELLRLNSLNEEKARKLKPGDRLRTR